MLCCIKLPESRNWMTTGEQGHNQKCEHQAHHSQEYYSAQNLDVPWGVDILHGDTFRNQKLLHEYVV